MLVNVLSLGVYHCLCELKGTSDIEVCIRINSLAPLTSSMQGCKTHLKQSDISVSASKVKV